MSLDTLSLDTLSLDTLSLDLYFKLSPLCSSLPFLLLFSDSVDNNNNYNHEESYKNINYNNVGYNDINNNNSFRKCSLSYPEPP